MDIRLDIFLISIFILISVPFRTNRIYCIRNRVQRFVADIAIITFISYTSVIAVSVMTGQLHSYPIVMRACIYYGIYTDRTNNQQYTCEKQHKNLLFHCCSSHCHTLFYLGLLYYLIPSDQKLYFVLISRCPLFRSKTKTSLQNKRCGVSSRLLSNMSEAIFRIFFTSFLSLAFV